MENRARYALVGISILMVTLAGFGFVYWLKNFGGFADRVTYQVRFDGSVAGLLLGSAVQFNGMKVGEVTDLTLNPDDPRQVLVTIAVSRSTPVRADTEAGLTYSGLTGVPGVALTGGSPDAPPPQSQDGAPPLLVASPGGNVNWTDAARDAFARVDTLLSENSDSVTSMLDNLDTFATALGRNSDYVDGIMDGLARLAGARPGGRNQAVYSLAPAYSFPPISEIPQTQLVINQPSIAEAFNSPQFMVREKEGSTIAFERAGWSDNVPKIIQEALIRSFENAGYARVGREFQDLAEESMLLVDVVAFEIVRSPELAANVVLSAKLNRDGQIVAMRRFEDSAAITALEPQMAAAGFSEAFADVAAALVPWTIQAIATLPPRESGSAEDPFGEETL
jgi:phospholipid/cholesterol/gamma-HCH transport system substrate-binding protein